MAERRRIVGLDLGRRRIGVAVSDEMGLVARGLPTLERGRRGDDLAALQRLAREQFAARFVLGLPLQLDGVAGSQAGLVRNFGVALAAATRLPVEYWDERLTSVEAGERLRAADRAPVRGERVDKLSAVLILQSYLDAHRPS